ncbi:MAG: hypothetical protein DMD33_01465 [Gemmatimonadetes bacterium]|nr:MAG: hypothetical protein DMD33_01465 [Gemmatimonadota bacterium]PYO78680.1 MAG: hypothetical protein DMD67_04540 [Gemmatimonadota bacterium]PYO99899.1 MAG: hypothetical protein DMD61_05890 [Gemmatimonadota bacterium]TLY55216.1 MAG: glycosyltransferase [Gemmatimonadota bacterium]TLY55219.1 MAG: glycosyltransferase [Gemmatimonadota bacterium]
MPGVDRALRLGIPHEVILVDNASADGTVDAVRARFPSVRIIANEEKLGLGRGIAWLDTGTPEALL